MTRYDVETGEALPVEERFGLLDRKLRVVSEQAADPDAWKTWALRAVQATYGYELQGDNLLIARVNVLCSVEEHMLHRWKQKPEKAWLEKLCNVICWNLWQMDGLRGCVPVPPQPTEEQLCLFAAEPTYEQESLFGETREARIGCRLYDWRSARSIRYQALREKGPGLMKFDFIIGNPPYQEEVGESGNKTYATPIYNKFIDCAYELSDRVELIHPARFLFNAGSTPKQWNRNMLTDPHLAVVFYEANSSRVFTNTEIKGGVAITYHDKSKNYGKIGTFTPYSELNSILRKVRALMGTGSLSSIVVNSYSYHFTNALHSDYPEIADLLSKGHAYDLKSNVITKLPQIFHKEMPNDGYEYIRILGRISNERAFRFIRAKYINNVVNLNFYKVFLPAASGNGGLGEELASPLVMEPGIGSTETFCSIGCFATETEAQNALKYIKSKFARALLSVLKVTQHITPEKFAYVPLQDFTPASDIDWSRSIPEIDRQLYAKYGLDEAEIAFIETHVKEMA